MSQPIAYVPAYNFTSYQAANPSTPLPADKLDTELNALKITTDSVRVNMALLQADDGTLKVQVVTPVSLSTSTLALLSSTGVVRGAWVTATVYAAKDIVTQGTGTYICVTAHTAGVFATDLAAVKWVLLAGSTGTVTLASLSDCTITTPAVNQGIYYNGTKWVNGTLVAANVTDGVLTFAKMASAFSITDTGLVGASNTNVPTTTAIKTYVDTQISRGTASPVASATTTSLTGTYDYAHITGTTTITGITLATNEEVWVIFDGILTLTHNSVALILPGAANITTAANDRAKLRGIDGTNVICLDYVKASGQPVIVPATGVRGVTAQVTDSTDIVLSVAPTQANFGSTFSLTIPTKGTIELSFAGVLLAATAGNWLILGLRIGSTNYFSSSTSYTGSTNYNVSVTSTNAGTETIKAFNGVGGAVLPDASPQTMKVGLNIEKLSIPTGPQTVQIIACKDSGNAFTIKGTTSASIVNITATDHS